MWSTRHGIHSCVWPVERRGSPSCVGRRRVGVPGHSILSRFPVFADLQCSSSCTINNITSMHAYRQSHTDIIHNLLRFNVECAEDNRRFRYINHVFLLTHYILAHSFAVLNRNSIVTFVPCVMMLRRLYVRSSHWTSVHSLM
jgi:hypothetical protein